MALFLVMPCVVYAEGQFSTVDVLTTGPDGESIVFSLDVIGDMNIDDDGQLSVQGTAYSSFNSESGVPIVVTAEPAISELELASAATMESSAGFTQSLSIFSRSAPFEESVLTRLVAVGSLDNGTPVAITAVDDPSPWLIPLIIMSARIAVCYAAPMLYECPGGFGLKT
jgi:hypothetical protein